MPAAVGTTFDTELAAVEKLPAGTGDTVVLRPTHGERARS
jgi:hypothetical protein